MRVRSIGVRTDLVLAGFDGEVRDRGAHLVVRTPANPSYWFGNMVVFGGPPAAGDLPRWESVFRDELAHRRGIEHVCLYWDSTGGEAGAVEPFVEAAAFLRFQAWNMARYRRMEAAGFGRWYGAFAEGVQVAGMGVFGRAGLGRCQAVATHPDHWRRGACGAPFTDFYEHDEDQGRATLWNLACLDVDGASVSLAAPQPRTFTLTTTLRRAGRLHVLVGSSTGTWPGLPAGHLVVPLNPDAYLDWSLATPGGDVLQGSLGALDPASAATVVLDLPGDGALLGVSNPRTTTLVP